MGGNPDDLLCTRSARVSGEAKTAACDSCSEAGSATELKVRPINGSGYGSVMQVTVLNHGSFPNVSVCCLPISEHDLKHKCFSILYLTDLDISLKDSVMTTSLQHQNMSSFNPSEKKIKKEGGMCEKRKILKVYIAAKKKFIYYKMSLASPRPLFFLFLIVFFLFPP